MSIFRCQKPKPQLGSTKYVLDEIEREPYETVFIIGTGLIENGWDVFKEALEKAYGHSSVRDAPIHHIAVLTFILRMFALSKKKKEKGYRERIKLLDRIRKEIGDAFLDEKRFRLLITENSDYVEKLKSGKTLLLTTNYDPMLENYYVKTEKYSLVYLHGNVRESAQIYLPTETAIEPYREKTDWYLAAAHRIGIEALEKAKRVVIWANSLDNYDAELCVLLGETHRAAVENGQSREYFVVDLKREPAIRLQSLLGGTQVMYVDCGK